MTVKREDVDRREVDFSDVTSGRRLPPVHPGEILRDEFLTPMELSVYRLARALKISRPRLNDIVLGTPRRHHRYRVAPRALFRNDAGVLDQSSEPPRPGRRGANLACRDRARDRAPCRNRNPGVVRPWVNGVDEISPKLLPRRPAWTFGRHGRPEEIAIPRPVHGLRADRSR